MTLPELHLSRPAVILPGHRTDNDEVISRVRGLHRGETVTWPLLEEGIRHIFQDCNSRYRYLDEASVDPGDQAAGVARECLERHGVAASALDVVVYAGMDSGRLSPAVAAGVAARLGVERSHAFDVGGACAGMLEALHAVASIFALDSGVQTALVCSAELMRGRVSYDVQSLAELEASAAGLTFGNAAAAYLVSRGPLSGGSARVVALRHGTTPGASSLAFLSRARFEVGEHVVPELRHLLVAAGWQPAHVDHFLCHQASETMILALVAELGIDPAHTVLCHSRYGDTASTSALLALEHRAEEGVLRSGDNLVLASAVAGCTVAAAAAVWD